MSANISIAKSYKSGRYIHIDNINKELDNDFICNCGSKLIAVKTEARKKDWHFRHVSDSDIAKCRSTALHDYAVQIIKDSNEITIAEKLKIDYLVKGIEVWLSDYYRSDITVKYQNEDVHFEVFVTHDLSNEKIKFYKENKIRCVWIDLSKPELLTANPEFIKDEVLKQYNNKKLIHWGDNNNAPSNQLLYVFIALISFIGLRWLYKKIFR